MKQHLVKHATGKRLSMTVSADRVQKCPAVKCILCPFSEIFKGFSDCRTLISLTFAKGQEVERFCLCFQKIRGFDIIVLLG